MQSPPCEQRGASLNARAGILNFPNWDCCHADICGRCVGLSERIEPGGYIPECFSGKPPRGFESVGQCRCFLHCRLRSSARNKTAITTKVGRFSGRPCFSSYSAPVHDTSSTWALHFSK